MLKKIVSGGQTGVDRAALNVALELSIACGGWCPKGRRAEDGTIPERYPLQETSSEESAVRTKKNVLDSDGTLILIAGQTDPGTALTLRLAKEHHKPHWIIDLDGPTDSDQILAEMEHVGIETLNVAGPRESSSLGIAELAERFLREMLSKCQEPRTE